jgi:hypothetical protein
MKDYIATGKADAASQCRLRLNLSTAQSRCGARGEQHNDLI